MKRLRVIQESTIRTSEFYMKTINLDPKKAHNDAIKIFLSDAVKPNQFYILDGSYYEDGHYLTEVTIFEEVKED